MNKIKIFLVLFSFLSIDLISNPNQKVKQKRTKSSKKSRGGGIKSVQLNTPAGITTAAGKTVGTAVAGTTVSKTAAGTTVGTAPAGATVTTAPLTTSTMVCPKSDINGLLLLKNSIYNKESASHQISEMKRFNKDVLVLMMRPSASEHRNYMYLYIFFQLFNKIIQKNPEIHHLLLNTDASEVQALLPADFKDKKILHDGHPAFFWIEKKSLSKANPLEDMKLICKRSDFNDVFKTNGNNITHSQVNQITNFMNSSLLIKALNKILFDKAISLGIYFSERVRNMFKNAANYDSSAPVKPKTITTTQAAPSTTTTAAVK